MKHNNTLLAIVAMAILGIATVFVSCKKEQAPTESPKCDKTVARIMDFKYKLEAVEATSSGRTITYMSVADAVWNVEALFNFTYAYPDKTYSQTVSCDTTLNLYVCANDSVLLSDLSAFFGQMFTAVQTLYQAVDLDDPRRGGRRAPWQPSSRHAAHHSGKRDLDPTTFARPAATLERAFHQRAHMVLR